MAEFGQEKLVTFSPVLVLLFEEKISERMEEILEKGEVDDRDTMALAASLSALVFEEDEQTEPDEESLVAKARKLFAGGRDVYESAPYMTDGCLVIRFDAVSNDLTKSEEMPLSSAAIDRLFIDFPFPDEFDELTILEA